MLFAGQARAEATISPAWSSDRIRELRGQGESAALVIRYHSHLKSGVTVDQKISGTVRLWSDVEQVSSDAAERITDYKLCRTFSWTPAATAFDNDSCYADPAFRQLELANRLKINSFLKEATVDGGGNLYKQGFWIEQEFSIQNQPSDPLTLTKGDDMWLWQVGDEIVAKASVAGLAFAASDRQRIARYFARHIKLHPQIRRDILASGKLPAMLEIHHVGLDDRSVETINFLSIEQVKLAYPLPAGLTSTTVIEARGDSVRAQGLRQSLKAIDGTALPAKTSFEALLADLDKAATNKQALSATLIFFKITQYYGGSILTDAGRKAQLAKVMQNHKALIGTGEAAALWQISNLAGVKGEEPDREAAARYLADAKGLDQLDFGSFRYVTFANLVSKSGNSSSWNRAIFAKMPPLFDNYWAHIIQYPWSGNTLYDLGNSYLAQYNASDAWRVWDMGKAIDPDWRGGLLANLTQFEQDVKQSQPEFF